MNPQIEMNRMELIIALRSNNIEQCFGHLATGDKRCFMGVAYDLFEILDAGTWEMTWHGQQEQVDRFSRLAHTLGFPEYSEETHGYHQHPLQVLVAMNDAYNSFPELAGFLVRVYDFPDVYAVKPVQEEVLV